jgi:hypothetical protein
VGSLQHELHLHGLRIHRLLTCLQGAQATVFAPTNAAFSALLAQRPDMAVFLTDPALAAALASYHGEALLAVSSALSALAMCFILTIGNLCM